MGDIVYTAEPELRRPAAFLAAAAGDLRAGLPIGVRLFRSNLQARYRRSRLGYVWLLLPALGTAALAAFIQSRRIVAVAPTELPYPLFVLAGIILWQLFGEALNAPMQQLNAGRQLITRSRVPHEALIAAGALEVLLNAGIRLLVLLVAFAWFGIAFSPAMLLVPLGVVALAVLGLAIGMLLAPIGLLYDDVGRGLTLLLSFGFFVTPIVYPIPAGSPLRFNPLAPLIETVRHGIAGAGAAPGFWIVGAGGAVLLVLAWLFYRLARPHFLARLG
ncbi:MAG TPA: ABC transporter permease [Allosphingosinicella sp.]|jgi:lipopolysaccharide transport system permease protein